MTTIAWSCSIDYVPFSMYTIMYVLADVDCAYIIFIADPESSEEDSSEESESGEDEESETASGGEREVKDKHHTHGRDREGDCHVMPMHQFMSCPWFGWLC